VTDQRSIERKIARDLKLLAQNLVFDGIDADGLRLTGGQQMLTVCGEAQRAKTPGKRDTDDPWPEIKRWSIDCLQI